VIRTSLATSTLLLAISLGCSPSISTPTPNAVATEVASPHAAALIGKVVGISDGDTITVLDASKQQHKIRLEGIDAPESHQAFGARAKQELSSLVFGKEVRVDIRGRDQYGRELGHISVGDLWINRDLVAAGFAWHFKQYSSDSYLAAAEVKARASKAGLGPMWTRLLHGTSVDPHRPPRKGSLSRCRRAMNRSSLSPEWNKISLGRL
jgi:endonuclease YncB( thermonuclease family)